MECGRVVVFRIASVLALLAAAAVWLLLCLIAPDAPDD